MIDHLEMRTLAATSIDGPLPPADQATLEHHLFGCPACRDLLRNLRSDQRRLADLGEMPVEARTREVVLAEARGMRPVRPWVLLAAAALLLVAMTVALVVAGAILRSQRLELTDQWQGIPAVALGGGAASRIRAITATADGLFAVGSIGSRAAVWTSADGSTWDVISDLPGGNGAELMTIAAGGPGLIAAGRSGSGPGIWLSADGRSWRAAEPPAVVQQLSINELVAGPGGWLAIGGAIDETGMHGMALTSEDGLTWERSKPIDTPYGMPPLQTGWALPDGGWEAVATFPSSGGSGIYVSDDGITWTETPASASLERIGGTTSFRSRLFVFGLESRTVQTSADAITWNNVAVPVAASEALAGLTTLQGAEIVLLGSTERAPLLLRSIDGTTWRREVFEFGGRATAYDMASLGQVEVVVGIQGGLGAVWIRER